MAVLEKRPDEQTTRAQKIINITALVLCIILVPVLIMNCVLIIKDMINPKEVPSVFGNIPLIVLTESMEPDILAGDLIVCKKIDPKDVKVDDVISYFDPEGSGSTIITHKVVKVEVDPESGDISFRTYGINNNIEDRLSVPAENVVGIWNGTRFWQLGRVLLFTQSIPGILLCVILPIAAVVAYEVIRRKKQDQNNQSDIDKLRAELEAMKAANAAAAPAPANEPTPVFEPTPEVTPEAEPTSEVAPETEPVPEVIPEAEPVTEAEPAPEADPS